MELNIIEKTKNKLKLEIKGEGHTFCNALRKELWNDKHLKAAGYTIEHSLVSEPTIVIETTGEDPKKVLIAAVNGLKKKNKELKDKFKKAAQ